MRDFSYLCKISLWILVDMHSGWTSSLYTSSQALKFTRALVCWQIAHKYLVDKHLSPADETQFKEQLYRIWFELYARRGSSRWVDSGTAPKYNLSDGIWHHPSPGSISVRRALSKKIIINGWIIRTVIWTEVLLFFSTRPDSSGFEHVFVGETRGRRTVIGFHNWIQLYLQEKLGHIDYKGYSVTANSPQVWWLRFSF